MPCYASNHHSVQSTSQSAKSNSGLIFKKPTLADNYENSSSRVRQIIMKYNCYNINAKRGCTFETWIDNVQLSHEIFFPTEVTGLANFARYFQNAGVAQSIIL